VCGLEAPDEVHGKSMVPLMNGKAERIRELAVSSPSLWRGANPYARSTVTTDEWTFIYGGAPDVQTEDYEDRVVDGIPRKHTKLIDQELKPMLFNNRNDPLQNSNIYDEHKDVAGNINEKLISYLREIGTPEEFLASRKALVD